MKFARIGPAGAEKPAVHCPNGIVRDLWSVAEEVRAEEAERLRNLDISTLPVVSRVDRFSVPVTGIGKIVAIGLNCRGHAREADQPIPQGPVIFMKAITCLSGPDGRVPLPRGPVVGVVIGRRARYVEEACALTHVAGYVLVNDLSERQDQLQRGGTWDKGKSHDGFGPVGPWLVTRNELGDAGNLPLTTRVNGQIMQQGDTSDMIFGVANIVSYVSRFMTLEPGDIIATGKPSGVGGRRKPEPIFRRAGDLVELDGGPLGTQAQRIVASI